jgi:serine/threonine protein kinase
VSARNGCISRIPEELPKCCADRFEYVRTNTSSAHPFDLGYGAYAVVRKIRDKTTQECYAVKIVEKQPLEIRGMLGRLYQEVHIQRGLSHKNILGVCGFDEDPQHVFLQLQLCEKGAMSEIVDQFPQRRMTEDAACLAFSQVTEGVGYLHQAGIAHRDLKLSNLLVTSDDIVKVADFGWCCDTQFTARRMTFCGTLEAMPPEILENEPHGVMADIWALGVVLFQMIAGVVPFPPGPAGITEDFKATVLRAEAKLPPDVPRSEALEELLPKLLAPKPADRLDPQEILTARWVQEPRAAALLP